MTPNQRISHEAPRRGPNKRAGEKGITATESGSVLACAIDLLVELQACRLPAAAYASMIALKVAVNTVEDEAWEASNPNGMPVAKSEQRNAP